MTKEKQAALRKGIPLKNKQVAENYLGLSLTDWPGGREGGKGKTVINKDGSEAECAERHLTLYRGKTTTKQLRSAERKGRNILGPKAFPPLLGVHFHFRPHPHAQPRRITQTLQLCISLS
jgi:hypothetical protein